MVELFLREGCDVPLSCTHSVIALCIEHAQRDNEVGTRKSLRHGPLYWVESTSLE